MNWLLADFRFHVLAPPQVFFEVERFRPAEFQEGPFQALDLGQASASLVRDLEGDDADAVLVGVDQVAGLDLDAAELTGLPNRPAGRKRG